MDDENNGAIDLKDVRRLARGASTLRKLTSLIGGSGTGSRRSVPRSAAKKARTTRAPRSAKTVEIPGLGRVPASTVKKWAPTIGGLVLGRMLTRSSSSGGSSRRRRSSSAAPAQGTAGAPPQGNPYLKWIVLFFVVAVLVWWLADGGAQVCADALRRLQTPASEAVAPAAPEAPAAPAERPAKTTRSKRGAAAVPSSPEILSDGLWWEGRGVVEKVLSDDTTPPRHQRFFLRDDRGRSLFFAHNVDEAPRVPDLREGDEISFRGEWRDNERGGAMHWTHRAGPGGRSKGGWLERGGVRYE